MKESENNKKAKLLLAAGMIAGPLYVGLALLQMLIRPGFDPTRHDWSLFSNGDLGWIQIASFMVSGVLVMAAAIGIRLVLRGGRAGTWGPILLSLYGLGLIGAGLFIADPMNAFPLGTPDGPPVEYTLHGTLHIVSGSLGFIGLIAACFVFARRFRSLKEKVWANFSLVTGVLFLFAFFGIAGGSQQKGLALQIVTLAFTAAVITTWVWIALLSYKLIQESK